MECPDPNCRGRSANRFRPLKKDGEQLPSYGQVCSTMHENLSLPSDCGYYREEFGEWEIARGPKWTKANHQFLPQVLRRWREAEVEE